MRTFVLFGVRLLSERSWNATIDDAARERAQRLAVEEQLRLTVADSEEFANGIQKLTDESREKIKGAVRTVLACNEVLKTLNVHLAHRVEQAEHNAALLREQLVKVLRTP